MFNTSKFLPTVNYHSSHSFHCIYEHTCAVVITLLNESTCTCTSLSVIRVCGVSLWVLVCVMCCTRVDHRLVLRTTNWKLLHLMQYNTISCSSRRSAQSTNRPCVGTLIMSRLAHKAQKKAHHIQHGENPVFIYFQMLHDQIM